MRRTVGSNRLSPSRQTHLSTQTSTARLPQLQVRLNNPWHNAVLNCFLGTHPEAMLHAAGFDDAQAEAVIATADDAKKNVQCGVHVTRIPVVFGMGGLRPAGGLQGLRSVPMPVNRRTRSPKRKPLNPSSSTADRPFRRRTGATPLFWPPDRHGGVSSTYIGAAPSRGVAPVPKVPAGRQAEHPMKWRQGTLILAGVAASFRGAAHPRRCPTAPPAHGRGIRRPATGSHPLPLPSPAAWTAGDYCASQAARRRPG